MTNAPRIRPRQRVVVSNLIFLVFFAGCTCLADNDSNDETCSSLLQQQRYGVDVSYPMHSRNVTKSSNDDECTSPLFQFEVDRQEFYQDNIQGCLDYYALEEQKKTPDRCLLGEKERIEMIQRQPQSMMNYSKLGFAIRNDVPPEVWKLVQDFWHANRNRSIIERWPIGSTYGNHWKVPTHLVAIENVTLRGGGEVIKQRIWDGLRPIVSDWVGSGGGGSRNIPLTDSAIFGIRIYRGGAILAPHVDRSPLILGVILNVDFEGEEPWPLEVIAHDGYAYNVTINPGEMILYESHSIIHGRPFPLKGSSSESFMANLFIHYEPLVSPKPSSSKQPAVLASQRGDLPPYIIPNSPQVPIWRENNPKGWRVRKPHIMAPGTTEAHQAVTSNDMSKLQTLLEHHPDMIHAQDDNGWTPLHEAIRKAITRPHTQDSMMEIIKALIEQGGANVNALTKTQDSVLGLAYHFAKANANHHNNQQHPAMDYLIEKGAKPIMNGQEIITET